jgi:hypothetical protein
MSPVTPVNPNGPNAEDTNDMAALSAVVTPWTGGQKYDAEFLAVALDRQAGQSLRNAKLSILIVSGLRPDNGASYFAPGDIRVDGAAGSFGIEIGGGAAHTGGAGVAHQTETSPGYTYGLTYGAGGCIGCTASSTANAAITAGSIRKDATWKFDPLSDAAHGGAYGGAYDDDSSHAHPTNLALYPFEDDDRNQIDHAAAGTDVTPADMKFWYTADELMDSPGVKSVHSVIEMSFSADPFVVTDAFGNDILQFSIAWGPGCNNDVLQFDAFVSDGGPRLLITATEPASWLAFLGGLAFARRLRRRKKPA